MMTNTTVEFTLFRRTTGGGKHELEFSGKLELVNGTSKEQAAELLLAAECAINNTGKLRAHIFTRDTD